MKYQTSEVYCNICIQN